MFYGKVYADLIADEESGKSFFLNESDKLVLKEMCQEVNDKLDHLLKYQYLSEFNQFKIPGCGPIVMKYIDRFESEVARAALINHLANDKVKNANRLILDWFYHFKNSSVYISPPGKPSSVYIYVRYDNALRKCNMPKKIVSELVELAHNPRDFCQLPFTLQKCATRTPDLDQIAVNYLLAPPLTRKDVQLPETGDYHPSADYIDKNCRFCAMKILEKYPSPKNVEILSSYLNHENKDFREGVTITIEKIKKKLKKMEEK